MFSLSDKTVVITGAARGIGKSIAQLFARQGAEVHVLDLAVADGENTVDEIRNNGGMAFFHKINVAEQKEVLTFFSEKFANGKRLDILVNNAGIAHIGNIEQTTEADFDRVFSVNVKGAYNCSLGAIRTMIQDGGGVILNMASVSATLGIADRFAYSASKGAMLTMTYSIAKDYLNQNIRCNAISPARVHTPFVDGFIKQNYPGKEEEVFSQLSATQPIGRMGQPSEIASLALFLCSDEAAFITGSNYPIDGGFTTLNT